MDCRFFEHQVQLHIDGLLSVAEQKDMLQHAQVCPSCAALLQDMTELAVLLSAHLSAVEPPAGFAAGVMAALPELTVKQVPRIKVIRPVWRRFGTVAAAAALLLAAGVYSLWPGEEPLPLDETNTPTVAEDVDPGPAPNYGPVKPNLLPVPPDPIEENGPVDVEQVEEDEDDTQQPLQTPEIKPVIAEEAPPPLLPFEGGVDLPLPALDPPQPASTFEITVLAAYEDCDALLPSFNKGGQVEFYTKYKNKLQMWTQTLGAEEEPAYQDQVKALPALTEIIGSMDTSVTAGFSNVSAVSPDGRFTVINRGGDQPGIWLYESAVLVEESAEEPQELGELISALGGGKILCWFSDNNKFLYTDNTGKLFVYYIYGEKNIVPLYNGIVSCASWVNSKTVVFSGKMLKNERSAIYAITELP